MRRFRIFQMSKGTLVIKYTLKGPRVLRLARRRGLIIDFFEVDDNDSVIANPAIVPSQTKTRVRAAVKNLRKWPKGCANYQGAQSILYSLYYQANSHHATFNQLWDWIDNILG